MSEKFKLPDELLGGAVKVIRPTDLRNRVGMYMMEERGVQLGRNVDPGDVQDMIVEFTQRELAGLPGSGEKGLSESCKFHVPFDPVNGQTKIPRTCSRCGFYPVGSWEDIQAAKSTGSGAAVSASPQPDWAYVFNALIAASEAIACSCNPGRDNEPCPSCQANHAASIVQKMQESHALPASPGRTVCPKCGTHWNIKPDDFREWFEQGKFKVFCSYCSETFSVFHLADFAQFFPASLNGEKREPTKFAQKWCEDAFIILAGLKEAVVWELAPSIMKEINRLVESVAATTQGTPEGTK